MKHGNIYKRRKPIDYLIKELNNLILGKIQLAIESWQKALKLDQEIDYRLGVANSLNNLGIVYGNLGEYSKAIDYFQQSLTIFQEIGDRNGLPKNIKLIILQH